MATTCKDDSLSVSRKCNTTGLVLTKIRQRILSILVDSSVPLSAYDIVSVYKEVYAENIQAMTVYRVLDYLSNADLTHRLNYNNKYVSCSHLSCCDEHGMSQFFICTKCNKVHESPLDDAIIALIQRHASDIGHEVVTPHLEVEGICESCR
ncbi:Fur family transcriptional regulator [Alteromonas gracilis]|uniref:Fur family transcriptional regulator n=1 Tax=Alteromonas gracilis TaxID=1479524 RepID=UPI0030D08E6E